MDVDRGGIAGIVLDHEERVARLFVGVHTGLDNHLAVFDTHLCPFVLGVGSGGGAGERYGALTAVDGEIGVGRHDFEGALSHGVAVFTASGEEGAGTGEQGDEKMLMHGEKSWEMNY